MEHPSKMKLIQHELLPRDNSDTAHHFLPYFFSCCLQRLDLFGQSRSPQNTLGALGLQAHPSYRLGWDLQAEVEQHFPTNSLKKIVDHWQLLQYKLKHFSLVKETRSLQLHKANNKKIDYCFEVHKRNDKLWTTSGIIRIYTEILNKCQD